MITSGSFNTTSEPDLVEVSPELIVTLLNRYTFLSQIHKEGDVGLTVTRKSWEEFLGTLDFS